MLTGSPTRLDRTRILDAAERLADRDGAEAISMRALGSELGADPTAVYRHFPSRDAILFALSDRMFAEVTAGWRPTDDWRADLRRVMLDAHGVFVRHRDLALALVRQPWESDVQVAATELILDALTRAGLRGADRGVMLHVIVAAISGSGLYFALDPATREEASRAQLRAFHGALPPATHPRTVDAAADLFPSDDEVYAQLVETLLDGIALRATAPALHTVPDLEETTHA